MDNKMMKMATINPATGEILAHYPLMSLSQINKGIDAAHQAYQAWRQTDFSVRKKRMLNVAKLLRKKQDEYAYLMA
jgi:succinate-semialdehyde dehydrogenase/glutarate-semialdehyde dehydrogenase